MGEGQAERCRARRTRDEPLKSFEAEWAGALLALRRVVEAYERGQEHPVVAGVVVIASGRKPLAR